MNAVSGRSSLASQLPQGVLAGMTWGFTADEPDELQVGYQAASLWF
jgi:hypothetical protein